MALLIAVCVGVSGFFVYGSIGGLRCGAFLLSLTAASTASSSRALGLITGIGGRIPVAQRLQRFAPCCLHPLLRFSVALVASIITLASVALAIPSVFLFVVTAALA